MLAVFPRVNVPRDRGGSFKGSCDSALEEVKQCYFCPILLVQTELQGQHGFKARGGTRASASRDMLIRKPTLETSYHNFLIRYFFLEPFLVRYWILSCFYLYLFFFIFHIFVFLFFFGNFDLVFTSCFYFLRSLSLLIIPFFYSILSLCHGYKILSYLSGDITL